MHNCFMCLLKCACICVCDQDNIGELDTDRQDELKRARRGEEEEEEKGRKSALLFGSEDTFDSIASLEEKVCILCLILLLLLLTMLLLKLLLKNMLYFYLPKITTISMSVAAEIFLFTANFLLYVF